MEIELDNAVRQYVFSVGESDNGIQVKFNTLTQGGQLGELEHEEELAGGDGSMTIVDISLIVLSLAKMLRDSGMSKEDLKEFFSDIVQSSEDMDAVISQMDVTKAIEAGATEEEITAIMQAKGDAVQNGQKTTEEIEGEG